MPGARPSAPGRPLPPSRQRSDRKSTRLNSSHANISYAVFCLKKKKIISFHLRLVVDDLNRLVTVYQKRRWLPHISSVELLASLRISDPHTKRPCLNSIHRHL